MKTLSFFGIFLAICLSGCSSDELKDSPKDDPTALFGTDTERYDIPLSSKSKEVNAISQQFAINLFRTVAGTEKGNCCISPLSASLCLGMVLNGADKETYREIQDVLGYKGFSNQEINEYVQTMQTELPKLDGRTLLTNANSLWINNLYTLLPGYIQLNKTYYNAEVSNEPFDVTTTNKINQWCNDKTNGLIPQIVDGVSPDAVCYLMNAIYFKGQWANEFKKADTKEHTFYTSDGNNDEVMMMMQKNNFNFYRDKEVTIVELPYGNKALSMIAFIPTLPETENIDHIISTLDQNKWEQWMSNMKEYGFELYLPRFKMEKEMDLIKTMQTLGIHQAFTEQADFSKMSDLSGIYINLIRQNTSLEVNEAGSEVTAVTITGIATSNGDESSKFNPWPTVVKFDHPFGYVIRENSTGAILFAGKVVKPEQ